MPAAGALVATATIVVGLLIRGTTRIALGTPLPPFLFSWSPLPRWPALIAAAVAGGLVWLVPRAIDVVRPGPAFAGVAYVAALALGLAVNAARRGPSGWSHVFDLSGHGSFEASREYLPALTMLRHGVGSYIRHFAQLLPYLPTHTKGNPPGPVIAMHLLGITTAGRLSAACVLVGALCAPLTYALGRTLGTDRRGRVAAALALFSPSLVLFGVTSVDYVFAALATGTAWLLVSPGTGARIGGCALVAVGSFCSWLLLAIPVWAVLVVAQRRGWRAGLTLGAGAGAAVLVFTLALAALAGYDPVAILRAVARAYRGGAASQRPYVFWLFGSPVAWLVMLGLPTAWIALRSLANRDSAAVALAAVIAVSAVAGFTKAETERIWLAFVPLACVAAATVPIRRLRPLLLALAVQALAVEVLFGTVW
jgi:methylthioxylose transferase